LADGETRSNSETMRLDRIRELCDYLVSLGATLSARGASELGCAVLAASRTVAGVPSTEFLGESRIVLRRIENEKTALTEDERVDLLDILRQLNEAFDRRKLQTHGEPHF
jgi:hypothetical protein